MSIAGVLGGTVSFALRNLQKAESSGSLTYIDWLWHLVAGLGASFLIPLFLNTVSSKLFEEMAGNPLVVSNYFIFGAFCLLAAIVARPFIDGLAQQVLIRKLEEVQKNVKEAKDSAKEAKEKAQEAQKSANQGTQIAIDTARAGVGGRLPKTTPITKAAADIEQGKDPNDPRKGQFGGSDATNNRRLEASVVPLGDQMSLCRVNLRVVTTDLNKPLTGNVQFFLHPTFSKPEQVVPVVNGVAELNLVAYGAFTVGVLADDGQTKLEYDLAKSNAPDWFKAR